MAKGTPAKGKRSGKKNHIICRRCGRHSYHVSRAICASCGYGRAAKKRQRNSDRKKR